MAQDTNTKYTLIGASKDAKELKNNTVHHGSRTSKTLQNQTGYKPEKY